MSHTHPNAANIASPFHGQPKTPVEDIKARYDADMRALWMVEDGNLLVGTDAAGIQLRILAHYMKSEAYRSAILDGNKDDGTDIHNLNRKALGHVCKDRDTAKTFIYAWLLGASIPKIAEILSCSIPKASKAVDNFLAALPELNRVKSLLIPKDAARGYFIGLDGRKVKCDSEHLMLAGYLQSGESIIMKRWIIEWKKLADVQRIKYKLVDFVHDETQVEVPNMEEAEKLQRVQKIAMDSLTKDLDLFCPMDVESDIGENWRETH
jgi:DNA polymerase-1